MVKSGPLWPRPATHLPLGTPGGAWRGLGEGVQGDAGCRVRHPPGDLGSRPAQQQEGRGGLGDAEAFRAAPGQATSCPSARTVPGIGACEGAAAQGWAGLMRLREQHMAGWSCKKGKDWAGDGRAAHTE